MLQESDIEFESNLQRLQEIFGQQPASHLRSLLLAHGMHKAIGILIGEKWWMSYGLESAQASFMIPK